MRVALVTALLFLSLLSSYVASKEKRRTSFYQGNKVPEPESDIPHERRQRSVVKTVWNALGHVNEFKVRVTRVSDVLGQVGSWLGILDAPMQPPNEFQDLLDEIEVLRGQVTEVKEEILAGQEWGFVLNVMGGTIRDLRTLVFQEEDFLKKMKDDTLSNEAKKFAQNAFYSNEANRETCTNRRELAALQNGILSGTGSLTESLYKAYANKVGSQATGTVFDLAKFITDMQELQVHAYAILGAAIDFKDISAELKQQEKTLINYDVEQVKPKQTPSIAKAINILMDLRGSSAWGRIRAKYSPHAGKCLRRYKDPNYAEAYVKTASCSEADDQLWQLTEEGHVIPKQYPGHALFFQQPTTSHRWKCWSDKKYPRPRVHTKNATSAVVEFQFSTANFILFQLRHPSPSDNTCVTTDPGVDGSGDLTCVARCEEIEASTSGSTWYEWQPRETA